LPPFPFLRHNHSVSDLPKSLARQFRAIRVERAESGDPNRFAFALSSEEPVQQWFGNEVLKHDSKSVRQDRLKAGVPLLFNHDADQHMGVVDSYSIKDKKLRVEGKWSSSDFAQQKKRDFEDGILKDASVGYLIHHITRDQVGEDPSDDDTLNVDDWEPLEASLVTVPADPTVGKGRSDDGKQEFPLVVEIHKRNAVIAAPAANTTQIEVRTMAEEIKPSVEQTELARRDRIMALASDKDFSKHVSIEDAKRAIEAKTSVEEFAESISRKIVAANAADKVGTAGDNVLRDAGRDAKRYSIGRAYRMAINQTKPGGVFGQEDNSFEREVSNEIAKRLKLSTGNVFIPSSAGKRTVTAGATGSGYTPQSNILDIDVHSDVIEMYRNRARVLALGATRMGGLSGTVRLPRQDSAATAQWLSETSAVTASDLTTDYVGLAPKRLSIQNGYTVELLAESAVDVDGLLARDRDKVLALAIDLAAIAGAGTPAPTGLFNQSGLATITSSGTTLTTGKMLGWTDITNFESTIAAANADVATMGWLFTPQVRGLLKATPMFPSGYAVPIWPVLESRDPSGLEQGPLGYKAGVTNQVPKNFGADTNLHGAVLGDWAQLIVADWGASELIVDPYTQAAAGIYVITERALLDVEFRHIQAFAVCETVAVS
jgi:HK97 family phage major capsid protein